MSESVYDFVCTTGNGNEVALADYQGKVLLVDLWGTWCPPCVSEIPTLIDLQERLGDRGLVIVAIAFEDADEDSVPRQIGRAHV